MGLFEPITHKEEIEETLARAQSIQEDSINRFNRAKKNAEDKLNNYGKTKFEVYNNYLSTFLSHFSAFKNVEMKQLSLSENQLVNLDPRQALIEMQEEVKYSKDMVKIGLASAGAGALAGIAAYGGLKAAGFFGSKLATSFAVKTVGAKAAVVAPFVFVPIMVVLGIGAAIKGKERLAEAKKQLEKARLEASKTDSYTIAFEAIDKGVSNYNSFVKSYSSKYRNIVKRIGEISNQYPRDEDGKINFDSLNEVDQRTLHLSWLMTQLLYGVLKQPLIDEHGYISTASQHTLTSFKNEIKNIELRYPNEVANFAKISKRAAYGWLVTCFVLFGISLFLSWYYYSQRSNLTAALLMLTNGVIAFPFSIFIKRMPIKFKVLLRIFRSVLCITGMLLIAYYGLKV